MNHDAATLTRPPSKVSTAKGFETVVRLPSEYFDETPTYDIPLHVNGDRSSVDVFKTYTRVC